MTDLFYLAAQLRFIAGIIRSAPVLSHWPHMRANDDASVLEEAAAEIEQLLTNNEQLHQIATEAVVAANQALALGKLGHILKVAIPERQQP